MILGVTAGAALAGGFVGVVRHGEISASGLTLGPLFMDAGGAVGNVPPVTGVSIQVGYAATTELAVIDLWSATIVTPANAVTDGAGFFWADESGNIMVTQ
jgi:hypothetical protein